MLYCTCSHSPRMRSWCSFAIGRSEVAHPTVRVRRERSSGFHRRRASARSPRSWRIAERRQRSPRNGAAAAWPIHTRSGHCRRANTRPAQSVLLREESTTGYERTHGRRSGRSIDRVIPVGEPVALDQQPNRHADFCLQSAHAVGDDRRNCIVVGNAVIRRRTGIDARKARRLASLDSHSAVFT